MATTNSGPLGYNVDGRLVPLDQVQNSLGYSHLYPSFNASMETPPSGYRPSFFDYNKPILDEKGNATYDKNGNQQFESAPQYYQPIQQQSYQNYNVDTPYGASQYGKGVQYLQNPFSYAPPGVSYGSQGGMGGMYNPFTYRGGNISASSGMGYGGYGSYGTQTPGAQTGGYPPQQPSGGTTPVFGPGGMFPALTGTQTGTQTGTPTGIDALIAAMQAYINGSPTATRISAPTQTSTSTSNPPKATATGLTSGSVTSAPVTSTPSNGGFVVGGGGTSKADYDKAVAIQTAKTNAENAARDAYKIPSDSPFYAASIGATGDKLNNLKEQAYEFQQRQDNRAKLAAANPGVDGFIVTGPDSEGYNYGSSKFGVTSKDWLPNVKTKSDISASIPDLNNPFTDTGAPTTSTAAPALSDLDQYALEKYGRPLTDTEKQVLSSMPLTDAQSIMDTSIANWNASQAAASTPSAKATSSDSSANNMARGGIASLLRRR